MRHSPRASIHAAQSQTLLELLLDSLFGELLCLPPQHDGQLVVGLSNLFSHGDETFGDIVVVLPQEQIGQFDEVYLLKCQCPAFGEMLLGFDESVWMFAPMPCRKEMMRSMVAVVETVSICLERKVSGCGE